MGRLRNRRDFDDESFAIDAEPLTCELYHKQWNIACNRRQHTVCGWDGTLVMEDPLFDPVEGESTPAGTGVAQLARQGICIASDVQPPIEEFPVFNVNATPDQSAKNFPFWECPP